MGCHQNGNLFLMPSPELPSPSLTLDLATIQPLGEWNRFTNFKSRNKPEECLSDEHTDSLPCSHIITRADQSRRMPGGERQWASISPYSDSSHQTQQPAAHRDLLLMHTLNQHNYALVPEAVLDWPVFPTSRPLLTYHRYHFTAGLLFALIRTEANLQSEGLY